MDIGTVIGLTIAVAACVVSVVMGGGSVKAFVDPASIIVVGGGTIGAVIVCFPLAQVLRVHKVVLKALFSKPEDPRKIIADLVRYAEVARREGILSLENLVAEMQDPFLVRGVKMAVDGTDPELIKQIMETELEAMSMRHARGKQILDTVGRLAPAYGMIGTLLGLILMLGNMDDPKAIGPGMAVALITTLYGALVANMVTGPLADKLACRDSEEMLTKTLVITGVMAIQSGDNPRIVESKLMTFLPPSMREDGAAKKAA